MVDTNNAWQINYHVNTQFTVLELIFSIVLVLKKLKHIILFSHFYLFRNGLIDLLTPKGVRFYQKYSKPIFQKMQFFPAATCFSLLMVIRLSW